MCDEARFAAMDLVFSVMENRSFTNLSVEQSFAGHPDRPRNLSALDRAFATAVGYGVITRAVVIDAILAEFSKVPLEKTEPCIRTILRMGVWQIFWSEKIPDFAACNESVRLAKTVSNKGAAAYVNAVLRAIARQKPEIMQHYILAPKELYLRCSLPRELAGYFKKWFGPERAAAICDAMNRPSDSAARVNTLRAGREELLRELEQSGCEIKDSVFMDDAFVIRTNGIPVENLPSFQTGGFTLQDEAAMLVGVIADPKPRQRVIDLCSAPGGKACHMAERMENRGEILAMDVSSSRLSLVRETADRLGVSILFCRQADASLGVPEETAEADVVLADVPCSGLGVLGKKPDIRIHMTHEKITALVPLQRKILETAAALVRPGGYLTYSTCTVNPEENENQIDRFLKDCDGRFEAVDFSALLPARLTALDPALAQSAKRGGIALYPDRHGCDGFFIAKLRRSL